MINQNIIPKGFKPRIAAGLSFALLPVGAQAASPVSPSTPEGWVPHFESLIAFMIVLTAVLIAWGAES